MCARPAARASRVISRRRTGLVSNRPMNLEPLEERALLAADVRSYDGTGNNLANPQWGSTNETLLRRAAAEYADGMATPAGADRPSARVVSNNVVKQEQETPLNDRDLAAFTYVFGQFLDHDMDLTPTDSAGAKLPISVPQGDPAFDPGKLGGLTIPLTRSIYDPTTGTSAANPRQQVNTLSAFIDGSQVYGSNEATALSLRTLEGGKLKTSEGNLLPVNAAGRFLAGDTRVNENIELSAIHTLFMREHNYWASRLARANPRWSDEELYQQARKIVSGELQAITYNEFLPALLGGGAIPRYTGYKPNVNPGITNEFSTASFRMGHSLLGDDVEFLDNDGAEVREEVALRDAFNNPALVRETGIDSIMKYLASDRAQELDVHIVDDVRDFLFGQPGQGGVDLASLNIQRGRDHGLADYNATRVAYGLRPVTSFAQITRDVEVQEAIKATYGNVNNIDLWVGGLAEDRVSGGSVGPLLRAVLVDQFTRLRDGDRFWYERDLSGSLLSTVRQTSLADVVRRNTTINNLQENVFFFKVEIGGFVYYDANGSRGPDRGDRVLPGVTVQLLDADGAVLQTTTTNGLGRYQFHDLDLETYRVRVVLPRGMYQTTANPEDFEFTKGETEPLVNFGLNSSRNRPTRA